jgi:hypothetical protein
MTFKSVHSAVLILLFVTYYAYCTPKLSASSTFKKQSWLCAIFSYKIPSVLWLNVKLGSNIQKYEMVIYCNLINLSLGTKRFSCILINIDSPCDYISLHNLFLFFLQFPVKKLQSMISKK